MQPHTFSISDSFTGNLATDNGPDHYEIRAHGYPAGYSNVAGKELGPHVIIEGQSNYPVDECANTKRYLLLNNMRDEYKRRLDHALGDMGLKVNLEFNRNILQDDIDTVNTAQAARIYSLVDRETGQPPAAINWAQVEEAAQTAFASLQANSHITMPHSMSPLDRGKANSTGGGRVVGKLAGTGNK